MTSLDVHRRGAASPNMAGWQFRSGEAQGAKDGFDARPGNVQHGWRTDDSAAHRNGELAQSATVIRIIMMIGRWIAIHNPVLEHEPSRRSRDSVNMGLGSELLKAKYQQAAQHKGSTRKTAACPSRASPIAVQLFPLSDGTIAHSVPTDSRRWSYAALGVLNNRQEYGRTGPIIGFGRAVGATAMDLYFKSKILHHKTIREFEYRPHVWRHQPPITAAGPG